MLGYIVIPGSISCSICKQCGARPIIALARDGEYVVRCPNNATHYQTNPGLIDIEDWNLHNTPTMANQFDHLNTIAC
ncbi:MAG TPA: hypothetical protein VK668_07765 [Mucilaginibacter sp.]|nr:hypothetical protein [Mucilaginibacter sp.]